MEARHLERYRVFRAIGTLPLRRDSLRGAWEDLAAAGEALRPGVGLWIYPQGQRRDASEPVANIERGAAHLAVTHRGPLRICPVAFRYAFESEQLPEAFALIGKSWMHEGATNRREVADQMEKAMNEVLVQLDARRREKSEGDKGTSPSPFTLLSSPRLSLNKQLDRVRHRLGLLKGDFDPRNG
jgi:1-acyl-sn-glycerol-3-phosphate acyltransferase